MSKFVCIMLAGGKGKRMGGKVSKQFLLLEDKPVLYYSLKAFGELYTLENQVECALGKDGVFAIAAKNGDKEMVILSNLEDDIVIETELSQDFSAYLIDKDNFIVKTDLNPKEFTLRKNDVIVLKNY